MRVLHTASHEKGQIYIPVVNWLLAFGTLSAVLLFGSSDALGGAYGIAVSMLMAITTVLAALVALKWGYNPLLVVAVNGFFFIIELVFVAANATKLIEGGWFPLLLACTIAFVMLTWRTGWQLLEQERSKLRQREEEFIEWVITTPPIRLPGAAAIFTAATTGIPLCLTHHLKHNRVLHERVLFIASISVDEPRVEAADRVKLVPVGAGITRVLIYFGFMETPDVMQALKIACQLEPELRGIDPENITYYFRRVMVIACDKIPGMSVWRKSLFAAMHLNANLPAAYFGVPAAQVVEVGLEVEI
jgi:KUP system potassium uptake protein